MQETFILPLLWYLLGLVLTLFTFSFLYKDNPFYKFAEHLVVGVSAGYFVVLLFWTSLKPKLIDTVFYNFSNEWFYILPGLLGIMMWFRFSRKLAWVSRYPIAVYIGIGSGLAIPLNMQNFVNRQLSATMVPVGFGSAAEFWNIFIVIGVICGVIYFFFSKEHKGLFGGLAKIGIWVLMIGFGASFGFTVMARISLFVNRIAYLKDVIEIFFGSV
ncbi:MAG: hypothetical protein GWO41_10325 [candidate division Zixibacteria bacterium]|nr:hypothetical protein [candidate division Zixibacteria bacterium]NIR64602.1 hypothetical protein [candidate division Zixibacteria bacterium]NIS16725.1 hypothetical protein [candidate division Zixibacteria bacterium]NIS46460.1 hypothetical protein [candidate division Zixibacteria bacterium]NIT53114.1 hypothetical protein [candidate division Zixibacteria bacterium]